MRLEIFFWLSTLFVFYAYWGYPFLLAALSYARGRDVKKGEISPTVSFIITAYNEEKRIAEKIENTLRQDYPKDRLEIVVTSDASTDRTDEIVRTYESAGVKLIRPFEGKGKESAQRYAIEATSGEILIFSDVATILNEEGARRIVENFNDPTVGCVSSIDRLIDPAGAISGEGAYVRYEMALRKLESKVNTLVGLSGSFFAARRDVCSPWAADLQSDFNVLLNSVKKGLRGVLDTASVGYYKNISDESREYQRKIRTVLRGIHVLMRQLPLLNPFRYGLFAWQLFSHKLCRWSVPFAMIAALIGNALLFSESALYAGLFIFQSVFYATAFLGIVFRRMFSRSILKLPAFFVLVNLSILQAWYRYFKGERIVRWEPSAR